MQMDDRRAFEDRKAAGRELSTRLRKYAGRNDGRISLNPAVEGIQGRDERLGLSGGPYRQVRQSSGFRNCRHIQRIGRRAGGNSAGALGDGDIARA